MLGVRSRSQDHAYSPCWTLTPSVLSVGGTAVLGFKFIYSENTVSTFVIVELYAEIKWTKRISEYWDCLNRHVRIIKCHVRHDTEDDIKYKLREPKAWTSRTSGRRWLGKVPLGADSWAFSADWAAGNPPSVMYGYYSHLAFRIGPSTLSWDLFNEFAHRIETGNKTGAQKTRSLNWGCVYDWSPAPNSWFPFHRGDTSHVPFISKYIQTLFLAKPPPPPSSKHTNYTWASTCTF